MMGPRQVEQGALFYNFTIDAHVPADHLLRSIDRFVDLSELPFAGQVHELEAGATPGASPDREAVFACSAKTLWTCRIATVCL